RMGLEHHLRAVLEQPPQDQHSEERRLPVLPCHEEQHSTEPEHRARTAKQLERVNEQPPPPLAQTRHQPPIVGLGRDRAIRVELLEPIPQPIRELDNLKAEARLRRQLPQRRSPQPWRLAAVELLTRAASPAARTSRRCPPRPSRLSQRPPPASVRA